MALDKNVSLTAILPMLPVARGDVDYWYAEAT